MSKDIPSFPDFTAAQKWMVEQVDDPYIDNYRFAYKNDRPAMKTFKILSRKGCCGSFEAEVKVKGKEALIGCNYGH